MWRNIRNIIDSRRNFVLTTHVNPDGDGIGAACALTELLFMMGKHVRFVCDSPIPQKFAFLDYHRTHEMFTEEADYRDVQALIMLDTHKRERIGRLSLLIDRPDLTTICIDHHEALQSFTPHLLIDSKACSVGAMIFSLYKACGFELNLRAAMGIYASVICDTGRFCYASTSREAHKIADECIKLGVDPDKMYSRLFQHVSLAEIKMFAQTLQGMEIYSDNKIAVQQICIKDCEKIGKEVADLEHIDLAYIHDFNNMIEDVQCVILLRELADDYVRVSLRSKTDLDISPIVRNLGGGGHANAAGLSWRGSLKEIKYRIIQQVTDLLDMHLSKTPH